MSVTMRWAIGLLDVLLHHEHVDRETLRAEMTAEDPDFARVRDVQHDALQVLAAKRLAEGIAIRREREFHERHNAP